MDDNPDDLTYDPPDFPLFDDSQAGPVSPAEAARIAAILASPGTIAPPNTDPDSLRRWAEFDRAHTALRPPGELPPEPPATPPPTSVVPSVSIAPTPEQALVARYLAAHPHTICVNGQLHRCVAELWRPLSLDAFRLEVHQLIETAYARGDLGARAAQRLTRTLPERLRLALAQDVPPAFPSSFILPKGPSALPLSNGLLALPTGPLRPFTREDMVTSTLPYAFDPAARAPVWEAYLQATVPDAAGFLQEFAGLALTFDTHHEIALWLLGPSGAGKSTFLHGLQVLLGPRCGELNLPPLLSGRFSPSLVQDKSLMVCPEPLDAPLANTARLNAFISGECLTLEPKYRPAVTIRPGAKLAWAFTSLPRLPDPFSPLYRRVHIVPFPNRPRDQVDPSLKPRLEAEGPGLLNWALAGLQRLTRRGRFAPPPCVLAATEQFRQVNDLAAQYLEERFERKAGESVGASQLNDGYIRWCRAHGHQPPRGSVINRDWARLGLERRLLHGRYFWHGLQIRKATPASPSDRLHKK